MDVSRQTLVVSERQSCKVIQKSASTTPSSTIGLCSRHAHRFVIALTTSCLMLASSIFASLSSVLVAPWLSMSTMPPVYHERSRRILAMIALSSSSTSVLYTTASAIDISASTHALRAGV